MPTDEQTSQLIDWAMDQTIAWFKDELKTPDFSGIAGMLPGAAAGGATTPASGMAGMEGMAGMGAAPGE